MAVLERRERENGTKTFNWRQPEGLLGLAGTPVAALPLLQSARIRGLLMRTGRVPSCRCLSRHEAARAARRGPFIAGTVALIALLFSVGGALTAQASPTARPVYETDGSKATRVVIPGLGIDMPVVSEQLPVDGNEPGYPLCDVAQYLVEFEDPGRLGTTYIYAHARTGMFLPLLEASLVDDGGSLLGLDALVYTDDSRLYTYRIFLVKRHATDLSLAKDVPVDERRLVLQTSEGPRGTIPVLQVAARLVSTTTANPGDAHPVARPRACLDPLPPLVPKRVLAAVGVGVVAILAVAWWLRKKRRHRR